MIWDETLYQFKSDFIPEMECEKVPSRIAGPEYKAVVYNPRYVSHI